MIGITTFGSLDISKEIEKALGLSSK